MVNLSASPPRSATITGMPPSTARPAPLGALLEPDGLAVLERASGLTMAGSSPLRVGTVLRREGVDPALAALALSQVALRERAVARFGPEFAEWVWTPASLEHATRPHVAARRARRIADAGTAAVADLGCGAGADSVALALAGLVIHAFDLDADALSAARHNAAVAGITDRIDLVERDVLEVDLRAFDAVVVDPARRDANGRRLMRPHEWSPSFDQVLNFADQTPGLVAKLAPGIAHDLLPPGSDTEWIQDGTDLVEATMWLGTLARRPGRSAVLLTSTTETVVSDERLASTPPPVGSIATYLYEPEPAVIRAGLVGVVVDDVAGQLLDAAIAYVTSDSAVTTPLASRYSVIAEVPFAVKKLRADLHARGYGNVVIKKRGVAIDPEQLRHSLRLDGSGGTATLILTRTTTGPHAYLVEPE